ncbi:MAG: polysaccharide biosynthesis/export family protein [Mesorhizobium sp.]
MASSLGRAGLTALYLLGVGSAALADEYRLGVQDKLTLRVVEWQIIENAFREWTSINGEYTVQEGGRISIPFAGDLKAIGLTTDELQQQLATRLKERFALKTAPEVSAEIAQYRPFFITGVVQSPGQYPFMPGLTVQKAVAVAGGTQRALDGQRIERELITQKGEYDLLVDDRLRLMVKRLRVEAEIAGKDDFEVPASLPQGKRLNELVAQERAIMIARKTNLDLQLTALADLKALLQTEIDTLEKKRGNQDRQLDLMQKELKGVGALAEQGLVNNSRLLTAERSAADIQGQRLDIDTAIVRARQAVSKAEQDALELRNSMQTEMAVERQQVEVDLLSTSRKMNTRSDLMIEASTLSPGDQTLLEFSISRVMADGTKSVVKATSDQPVEPGDMISVKVAEVPTR